MELDGRKNGQTPATKIRVQDLSVVYGRSQALFDVSLEIRAHSVTALIGPSGCGKSTFLRSLNRMNELIDGCRTSGRVDLDGEDVYGPGVDVVTLRRRVGMVFQRPNPFPRPIFDNVAYGPRLYGVRDRRTLADVVEWALTQAALWDEVKDRLGTSALELSGGQQQRLCIARALAVEPDVLLMDEPASALDPISTAKIEDLIQQLKERLTVVIVTHNMQQAGRIADETAFFLNGHLVEFDRTDRLFERPRDRRTEAYITGRFG
ncbi:phosphate ABC transporter ATP-binding protein PstB [Limnochorda pilosa]|uniref:Phosphate ABC transporter ATP-binding protein n=1 Tax=Limnochorda pilosa TaxID=1555112 RepID=A0A0K2SPE7_LIMPI|nr:phosphate ABC transporter ATP-binding protein PstB [Limnochorda pilosa]BAS29013.1 phosphate ABC transporter ATP-binding protein [Limnochorda pilosa]